MKRKGPILLACAEALALLIAIYFEPTYGVRGQLWGEAFFEGRPTSWWRRELERWEVREFHTLYENRVEVANWFAYKATWFDTTKERLLPALERKMLMWGRTGPKLLDGDANAIPVLRELLDDPEPEIRRFARIGLKMEAE